MSTTETLVFLAVIGSRFFVPLLIPKFPLPTIIACLVLDAADQSIVLVEERGQRRPATEAELEARARRTDLGSAITVREGAGATPRTEG